MLEGLLAAQQALEEGINAHFAKQLQIFRRLRDDLDPSSMA